MMSKKAWAYIFLIYIIAATVVGITLLESFPSHLDWTTFIILTVLATIGQLFKSEAPTHQLYHPALIFIFAGVLVLPPQFFAAMIIISHIVEWIRERAYKSQHLKAWYIQPFNISMHILIGLLIKAGLEFLLPTTVGYARFETILLLLLATFSYVILNHLIVGEALVLARNVTFKESGILDFESLLIDYVMFSLGIVLAILMQLNYWLIIPALTPLYMIYRALTIPILKQQANTDQKTNLWNFKYFINAMDTEIYRSNRLKRPLTVVVADLDQLRNINNAYGHLAGDAVLIGVAKLLKENARSYDIVARLGGEEFAILFPETTPEEAFKHVEQIRNQVEKSVFHCPVTHAEVRATISFGIAAQTNEHQTAREIIHAADIAVYQAKLSGRNSTVIFDYLMAKGLGVTRLSYEALSNLIQ